MPSYRENIEHDNLARPDALLFLRAFRAALGRYQVWGVTWLVLLLLSLAPALHTAAYFDRAVGDRYPEADLARDLHSTLAAPTLGLDAVFRQDNAEGLAQLDVTVASSTAVLALLALLFGVFAAGGWLQVTFEQPERRTLRRFGVGGSRYFGRFFRVALITLVSLALVHWILYGDPWKRLVLGGLLDVPAHDWDALETLESERTAVHLGWIRDGLAAIGFAKVLAWALYTRTRIALRDGRSALGAAFATWLTMARHPIQTFRPVLFLFLLEALVVLVLIGWWKGTIDDRFYADPNAWHVAALFGVTQLAVGWRPITRGAGSHPPPRGR
ncbi:MAG: hypothetical protein AAGB93_24790, partial [Planctomycetota bacterium]